MNNAFTAQCIQTFDKANSIDAGQILLFRYVALGKAPSLATN